ncbi:hypothetical protein [Puia sp.]|jgi:hypothetical protein|uniref:hypothetical protein n=1 Tax=Puia sp. TaxID=2045100 RepID=UPI002F3F2A09
MKAIVKLPVLILALLPFLTRCTNASSHETPVKPAVKKSHPKRDSLSSEPQINHIASGNLGSRISRVVCYSYLDIEDYEEDTFTRAPSFQMMPGFSRFFWKYDPHPKVVLTKKQTRRLLAIISTPRTYKPISSSCRSPRTCFCFYNKKKEIIGYYEVCFENSRLIAVPNFHGSESGTLSEQGAKRLRSLCLSAGISVR